MITLSSVNDAFSALLSSNSCVIHAKWNGDNPDFSNAYTDISVFRGEVNMPFQIVDILTTNIDDYEISEIDNNVKRIKITKIARGSLSGKISLKIQYGHDFTTWQTFSYTVVRETSQLDWILDWEGRDKTEIAGEYVITPKIFVGKSENGGQLTGTYLGPAFDGSDRIGVFGYSSGKEIFHLDNTGGMIGGWVINDKGLQTADGVLKILSEGSIISRPDDIAWQLLKDGTATFANGNVKFYANGDAVFQGEISSTAGKIGGWRIGKHCLMSDHIVIDSAGQLISISGYSFTNDEESTAEAVHNSIKVYGGVVLFHKSANDFGIEGWLPSGSSDKVTDDKKIFSLGKINRIAGWSFDNQAFYIGTKNNTARQNTTTAGDITIGTSGMRGMNWYIDNDGEISFLNGLLKFDKNGGIISGWSMTPNKLSVNRAALVSADGYTGLYLANSNLPASHTQYESHITNKGGILLTTSDSTPLLRGCDTEGNLVFQLCDKVNCIGGWYFDNQRLYVGNSPINSANQMAHAGDLTLSPEGIRGCTFRLEASGAGSLAKGKITWDTQGNLKFAESVTMSWAQITEKNDVMVASTYIDADGIFTGKVCADNITAGTISTADIVCDKKWALMRDGSGYLASQKISWTSKGELSIEGQIKATSGQIAGFKIVDNYLTNDELNNDACIIFRDTRYGLYSAIGGNVMAISSGLKAVARFENHDTASAWSSRNIALYLSAKNGQHNHAFIGYGNGTLNGWIGGYGFNRISLNLDNTIKAGGFDLCLNNRWLCKSLVSNAGVVLPELANVQTALCIDKSTPFCIDFLIMSDIGTNNFQVYGRANMTIGNDTLNTEQYPIITHWDGGRWEKREMAPGDCLHLLLIYDPSETLSIDGFSCKYTARIISLQA